MIDRTEVFEGVRALLVEALVVEPEMVTAEASLARDLGADSLDVMDIVVRLNSRFSLKLSAKELTARLRDGTIPGMAGDGETGGNLIELRRKMAERITVTFLVDAVERELRDSEPTLRMRHSTANS